MDAALLRGGAEQRCNPPGLLPSVSVQGRARWVVGSHLSELRVPSAAPSRILTTGSDVTKQEMRPAGGGRALKRSNNNYNRKYDASNITLDTILDT